MKAKILFLCMAVGLVMPVFSQLPAYLDASKPIEERVKDALSRMTLEEKIAVIHAQSKFSSSGVPRLGIPEVWCTDGPHGIRPEVVWDKWQQAGWTNDSCFAFPALSCLAATWNVDMGHLYGKSIGEEARYRKKTMLLGPGINIYRTPLNGRNFEYMGEDPHLAGEMAVRYIQGVQQNGVAACVKHFALNNQEMHRYSVNVNVDDRTLYELYLPAFKKAVLQGHAWAVMGAYNKYKHQHACHNQYLLNDILKGEWKFDGVAVSDWGGTHNTKESVLNGLDMEYGTGTNGLSSKALNAYDSYYLAQPYLEMIKSGQFTTKELDDKVTRVLRLIFRTEMAPNRLWGALVSDEHVAAGRAIGDEGIVLLKNDRQILPIPSSVRNVLVVGENAVKMMTVGGGSSSLKVKREIIPLEGLCSALASHNIEVKWERGYVGDISGEYNNVVTGQDLKDDRKPEELIAAAVKEAHDADYVIFIGGLNKSDYQDAEGADRKELALPYGQDAVIEALAAANKNLVVVNISGNAVAMPWAKKVPAIVQGWFLGSEAGNSLADVLTGKVNPSGKLPMTFPRTLTDVPAHMLGEYPGKDVNGEWNVTYNEGLYVGYRGVDKYKTTPLFAFGHGLSYTSFKYGNVSLSSRSISVEDSLVVTIPVKNIGKCAGKEIVQLYVHDVKASVDRPYKELKGFRKLQLEPGEEKLASFVISKDDLSYFDARKHAWVAEPGQFEVLLAAASDDIRSKASFELR